MRREIRFLFLIVLTAIGFGGNDWVQDAQPVQVTRSVQHRLESNVVGDTFIIQIRLSESFAGSGHLYPVLYILDGDTDEQAILTPWREFSRLIEERHYVGLRWFTHSYSGESHISVLPGALSEGLRSIYKK
jgi:hypothetical protein